MNEKTVVITGASGLLGGYLCDQAFKAGFRVVGIYNKTAISSKNVIQVKADLTDFKRVKEVFDEYSPEWVIHAAALTPVDYCEDNSEEAFLMNHDVTANIALECKRTGAVLHYISTMYVFDGSKAPYSEYDRINPLNVYGVSKLSPEGIVLDFGGVVARTTVVFGWNRNGRKNFATWLIDSLSKGSSVNVFDDMISTPTYAGDISKALLQIYNSNKKGIFHVCGASSVSRHGFAVELCDVFGFDKALLVKSSAKNANQRAKRPMNDSALISKLEKETGFAMPELKQSLSEMKKSSQSFFSSS